MRLKMTKKKIIKDDGRHLIFYEFEEEDAGGTKPVGKSEEGVKEE